MYARIIFTILIAMMVVSPVYASPIDPVDGIITHSFLDRESDTFVGFMTIHGETFGFSFLHEDSMPINGHTDVFTLTDDTLDFSQSDVMYHAYKVSPLEYSAYLTDKTVTDTCILFHMAIVETGEQVTICVNPSATIENGAIAVNFESPGTIGQVDSQGIDHISYFRIAPVKYTMYLPIIAQ